MKNKFFKGLFADIEEVPPILQSSYYPSLDGLRGVAITMVVVSHLYRSYIADYIFNGHLGVLIFFVISGFLITTLCIKEKILKGNISLRDFYVRRALRIVPVAYLYVAMLIVLNFIFKLHISWLNILGCAFYFMNFSSYFRQYDYTWFTSHFWSLSVEEQFYLIVPFILKKNFKIYLLIVLLIVFIIPVMVCLQYAYPILNFRLLYFVTHYLIKFQAIAVGCLLSVLTFKYSFIKSISIPVKIVSNLVAIFLIFYIKYDDQFLLRNIVAGCASSFLIGYVIITNIKNSSDFIFKLFNARILKTIGVLSYSIYIWQEIFTSTDKRLPAFMVTYPGNVICILVVSSLSYYFYERYFLKLKSKFSRIKKDAVMANS